MKILLTIGDMSITGGAERVVANLANAFVQNGHSVQILSFFRANDSLPYALDERVEIAFMHTQGEESLRARGGVLKRFYTKNLFKFFVNLRVWRAYRVDCVIDNDWTYTPFLKHKGTQYVKLLHLNFSRYNRRNDYFDTLVLLSSAEIARYTPYHNRVRVIPNFLPTLPTQSTDYTQKVALSIGRMDSGDQKGFLRLIDIWEIVVRELDSQSAWQLHIVGDGAMREEIQARIESKGLQDSILLKPFTTNIAQEYLGASVYAMASHSEGLPMVLIESASYGLPAIAFDIATGPSDIILDSHTGYLVADGDLEAYAGKLVELMSDKALRENLGKQAKERVAREFSKKAIMPLWEEILQTKKRHKVCVQKNACIGIVVPVYNVENYLARCLDSLLAQSYEDFVIVLVNDASTDSSREICLKYQLREKRVIFMDADSNAGLASVRNKALRILGQGKERIEALQGMIEGVQIHTQLSTIPVVDYVMFVDSDDYIAANALETITADFGANDVDICIYNTHYVVDERAAAGGAQLSSYRIFPKVQEAKVYTPLTLIESDPSNFITTACMFVYKASFLFGQELRFIDGILYEDVPFCTQSFLRAKSVYVSLTPWYYYFLSPTSTMRGAMSARKIRKSFESWIVILEFFIARYEEANRAYDGAEASSQSALLRRFYAASLRRCVKRIFELLSEYGYSQNTPKHALKPYLPYIRGKYRLFYHFPRLKKFL